jgi:hypothetical protein
MYIPIVLPTSLTILWTSFDSSDAQIRHPAQAMESKDQSPTQHGDRSDLKDEDFAKLSAEKQIFERTKNVLTTPFSGTGIPVTKPSTEQFEPDDNSHPGTTAQKEIPKQETPLPPPSPPPMDQQPSQGSSTASSIRLGPAVGEVPPRIHSESDVY